MQGQLFSSDFLLRGIQETEAWRAVNEADLDGFIARLRAHYAPFAADSTLNEAQTEDELIEPVIDLLGWDDAWISQVNLSTTGREDVPDFLLFAEPAAKDRALSEKADDARARHGVALLEAKRWLRQLDRGEEGSIGNRKRRDFGAPSSQMLRYLSRADVMSDRAVKWGILTNGAIWRLYWQDARSRAEEFFEIDLAGLLGVPGVQPEIDHYETRHGLKLFWLIFGRNAFNPQAWDSQRRTFHGIALAEARLYEETVSSQLGGRVFTEVFPNLCAALATADLEARKHPKGGYTDDYLEELREAALVLLYRLLFVLYAEDRRLLPVMDARYAPYSLTDLRDVIAVARDTGKVLSNRVTNYWAVLDNLFTLIAEGDDTLGMPAYNGGLFERARSFLLARAKLPDAKLALVIDALSRRVEDILKPRINYRDLSVAHLGGIYERLLEYRLEEIRVEEDRFEGIKASSTLTVSKSGFARKGSGSYYTHDALVRLILDETVGRLTAEHQQAFDVLFKKYRKKAQLKPYEWDALEAADPASRFLSLQICDPAMGSGHFLVALVDWLADRVLEAAQSSAIAVNDCGFAAHMVEQGRPWASPVAARIADIRRRILTAAQEHGWTVDLRQLDDRHIVRRMILKRVVYGVDKNVMAVELAKVGLWLHTFTVGAPLSFLDHHLQCGDSLHGERLETVRAGIQSLGSLFQEGEMARIEIAARSLESVAELTDTSVAEAHESKRLADEANRQIAPLHALLGFWRGLRWIVPGWPGTKLDKITDATTRLALAELFSDRHNLVGVAANGRISGRGDSIAAANELLARLAQLSRREHFFHWQTAFPTVWKNGVGGFDAVIGNPPWDRIKLQQVEWFAERKPEIALQARAADRKALIELERKRNTPLWREYLLAGDAAEAGARVVRECGDYPLLSSGDINLYSLFVERAQALARPGGIVGLLTPSGIAADKGASAFFRTLTAPDVAPASSRLFEDAGKDAGATGCRLAALYDFENRKGFFPDVDSRFKFCALVFGGEWRRFAQSQCAFYLHDVADLTDPERALTLSGEDFALVNPNTGAAPIFRRRRDAEITMRIYRNHPVLVNRARGTEQRAWPVRYVRMFDMTNDSGLFLTRAELEKQGFTPTALNRWVKDGKEAVPLYEGKMVQRYDHRAADVVINAANLHRAAQQETIQEAVKEQPDRYPMPQYWVRRDAIESYELPSAVLAFKDVTAPTNVRTMIAAMVPATAFGNTLPFLVLPPLDAVLLSANLNSFAFDFLARQKVQGQHLNWYILEQLPVIAPATYEQTLGGVQLADFIRGEVLALSYTAHDLAPFARDLGYVDENGDVKPPFKWNPEKRAQRMARLDALFMHLYGLDADAAEYILSTFPIVREQDKKAYGSYRTRDLILGYLARIEAGEAGVFQSTAPESA
ncbi:MAG: restriction endonuclease [Pseudomonadota bacterium]|nr:restriction endonuclease [Pseudomonadota bacterium]